MSNATWEGFIYGEERDGARSLGFKLLAPKAASWSAEVESVSRKLQACPYPETWRRAELFCSLLLQNGQRLVGVARYGLRDHSPTANVTPQMKMMVGRMKKSAGRR